LIGRKKEKTFKKKARAKVFFFMLKKKKFHMAVSSSRICLGITQKGTACKKKVISGYYCRFHATDLIDDDDFDLSMQKEMKEKRIVAKKINQKCNNDLPREEKKSSKHILETALYLQLHSLQHQVSDLEKTLLKQRKNQLKNTKKKHQLQDDEPGDFF